MIHKNYVPIPLICIVNKIDDGKLSDILQSTPVKYVVCFGLMDSEKEQRFFCFPISVFLREVFDQSYSLDK